MSETRKLAAILAADVVGFSRLTGADEDRTLARLRALRSDLIDPTIAVHHGRVVKRTGDGAIVEFRSVVDAVRCAIEVQSGMVERNAGLPAERRIEFRIGVHLGDVVEESDGDLMGDAVNIAARLEGIARPGAICLSEQAYWQVKIAARPDRRRPRPDAAQEHRRAGPGLFARGRSRFAGKDRDLGPGGSANEAARAAGQALHCGARVSEHERRPGAGVFRRRHRRGHHHRSLQDRRALVIARNSSFSYKGKSFDIRTVARELGVREVLEGSVRSAGGRLRINAQLIDAGTAGTSGPSASTAKSPTFSPSRTKSPKRSSRH